MYYVFMYEGPWHERRRSERRPYSTILPTCRVSGGRRLHTRNRHLGNHRGCSVAFSDGLSMAFSNGFSCFCLSGLFQRIVTSPVDICWKCPTDLQWHLPMEFHFCEFPVCNMFAPSVLLATSHRAAQRSAPA